MPMPTVGEILAGLAILVFLCFVLAAIQTWREMRKWDKNNEKGGNSGKTD